MSTRTALATSFLLFVAPMWAHAATLSLYPGSISLHKGDSVTFDVVLTATSSINTLGTTVLLPQHLTYLSSAQGPVVSQWVQAPAYDSNARAVSLGGIMTNGWSGQGIVATITVAADEDGVYSLKFDPSQTEAYKNDGQATPEPVAFGTINPNPPVGPLLWGGVILFIVIIAIVLLVRRRFRILFV